MIRRFAFFVLLAALGPSFAASTVRINEFLASNSSGLVDEDGQFSDWIELYNSGSDAVNLAEWFLTDNPAQPTKWEFPSVTLPAGGYLVVFASGKNRNSPNLHTNFNLDEGGEYLALLNRDRQIATEFAPAYPNQRHDVSYGYDSGGNLVYFSTPTPRAANDGTVAQLVSDTKFSIDRGFFDAPFELEITTATPDETIRYTTDGTPPTENNGTVYSGPIRIASTTTLRVAAFKAGFQPSNVDTQTYIFVEDVIHQSPDGSPPPGWPSSWGDNVVDYGMDPDVVNDPRYKDTIKSDLKSIPSFSIVMKLGDLFDPTTGIYANAGYEGPDWERPCSLELINPDGSKGFQINAGIRIRGGYSRSTSNPKHAFRFFFNQAYGAGKLNFPLFGKEGADQFDKIDLRTSQNFSWSFGGEPTSIFLRDQFSRDSQLATGNQAERGNFYHLYINGQYWGLFNTDERPEASYGATYFGGQREDYDTIKTDNGYVITATDGDMNAWTTLYELAKAGLASDEAYQKIQGNNPDGTPNPSYPVLIDIPNLIDYMLVIFYGGNLDAPVSSFLNNESPNNWFGIRNRNLNARMGFKFFIHDAEHTLIPGDGVYIDRTGPFPAGDTSVIKSSPQYIWKQLSANGEFRLKVADHVQRHFFNGGVFTPEANAARLLKRKAEIDRAVVGESARWGDSKRAKPLTRDDEWIPAINDVLNNFFPPRTQIVVGQLKDDGLYPDLAAPSFNQQGGSVNAGFALTMSAPTGTIYYTLDGTDPRVRGGGTSPKALQYSSAITLNKSANVRARALSGSTWSALSAADFAISGTVKGLMITELMYNPLPEGNTDGEAFEFIELKNIGSDTLDLSGVHFAAGIGYTFPNGTQLSAGAFYVLVANQPGFASRYPSVRIDGVYTNNLSNGGEEIALVDAAGASLAQFTYDDAAPWPTEPDGTGYSLVPRSLSVDFDYSNPANWRASSKLGGSPGADDSSDVPPTNHAPTANAGPNIELTSDTFPLTTSINGSAADDGLPNPPGALTYSWTQQSGPGTVQFSPANSPSTTASFPAAGVFALRLTVSDGALTAFGDVSITISRPLPGNALVPKNSVWKYRDNGADLGTDWRNISYSDSDWASGAGVLGYDAEEATTVGFGPDPIAKYPTTYFRRVFNVTGARNVTQLILRLLRDDGAIVYLNGVEVVRSNMPEDVVNYLTDASNVVGGGDETTYFPYTLDPSNLREGQNLLAVEVHQANPISTDLGFDLELTANADLSNQPPSANAGPDLTVQLPNAASLNGTASDDGLPNPPGAFNSSWSMVSGPGSVAFANATAPQTTATFSIAGTYLLRLAVTDGELTASDDVQVTVNGTSPVNKPPSANAGTDLTVQLPNSASLNGTASDDGLPNPPGAITASWSMVTGPGSVAFANAAANHTTATFTAAGTYLLRLTVADGQLTTTDDVQVTVNVASPGNQPPSANAGPDLTVQLPNSASLNGTASDDGLPNPPGAITASWSMVSGPGSVAFANAAANHTTATFTAAGTYLLRLTVTDSQLTTTDDVQVTVNVASPGNQAPSANAGPDLTVQLPNSASLNGTASDDGLPNPPGAITASWSMVSGPGSVAFANAAANHTTATFTAAGTYLLRLTVADGQLTTTDDVQVTVSDASPGDPYAVWRTANFSASELGDPSVSGDGADPDGDSFTNRQEFVAGTNPKDRNSFLHVTEVARSGANIFIRFEAVGGKSYSVQSSDNPGNGTWQQMMTVSPQGTTKIFEVPDAVGSSRKFYRIVIP